MDHNKIDLTVEGFFRALPDDVLQEIESKLAENRVTLNEFKACLEGNSRPDVNVAFQSVRTVPNASSTLVERNSKLYLKKEDSEYGAFAEISCHMSKEEGGLVPTKDTSQVSLTIGRVSFKNSGDALFSKPDEVRIVEFRDPKQTQDSRQTLSFHTSSFELDTDQPDEEKLENAQSIVELAQEIFGGRAPDFAGQKACLAKKYNRQLTGGELVDHINALQASHSVFKEVGFPYPDTALGSDPAFE